MALRKRSDHSRQSSSQRFFLSLWYRSPRNKHLISYLLLPLSCLLSCLASVRRWWLTLQAPTIAVPVVVVGNIAIGGTGKTPVVIALVKALQEKGVRVGVISRGYGSRAPSYPFEVTNATGVDRSGDEALLIAQSTQCPLVIDQNRVAAAEYLLTHYPNTQIIISDDGLQHYRLPRSLELVIVDGKRGMGNGLCIPAGPLREPLKRLNDVNWLLVNGTIDSAELEAHLRRLQVSTQGRVSVASIELMPTQWRHLLSGHGVPLKPLPWEGKESAEKKKELIALAAIGHPQRFFNSLESLGLHSSPSKSVRTIAFDDHHQFNASDFDKMEEAVVVMTTKDAVKCQAFAQQNWWALEVSSQLPVAFIEEVTQLINQK